LHFFGVVVVLSASTSPTPLEAWAPKRDSISSRVRPLVSGIKKRAQKLVGIVSFNLKRPHTHDLLGDPETYPIKIIREAKNI
jgi:hypothetical protein